MSGSTWARRRDRRRKKMALFLQELLSGPGTWACQGSDQRVGYSLSPRWLQWLHFLAFLFANFFHLSPAALHIFLFFWNPTLSPSAIKCVLTIWASSSLISYGAPKSTCIFQLPCTDCYTLEDSLKPFDFWKKMKSKLLHSLVSTSPLNSSLLAFSLVQPCCPPFCSSNTANCYFSGCTSFSTCSPAPGLCVALSFSWFHLSWGVALQEEALLSYPS